MLSVEKHSQAVDLGADIALGPVKRLYERYIGRLAEMSQDIDVRVSTVELRAFYRDELLCRVVPYRDLFHVLVGDHPVWETRVRNEETYLETTDRTLQRFLQIHASSVKV